MNKKNIGIPKEIKNHEYRVGATPDMVKALVQAGHQVSVETLAGDRIGFTDDMYTVAGAKIVKTAQEIYAGSEMIIKVKEPQESEFPLLQEGQVLFCYLHLAPDPEQTKHLLERKVVGIAYETVTDKQDRLPLLTPMSEIAGRIAIQAGATALQMSCGGRGVLLGGVPGVIAGKVVVIGGGVVGTHAARMALGLGADVTILDNNLNRLRELDALFGPSLKTCYSTSVTLENAVKNADLVVGAVLIPGKMAPKLITKKMVEKMMPGSVIVDVAIDQGGCTETSRPTTHSEPTYTVSGVVHYCVTNMPGACARTATQALTASTTPYALKIANLGYKAALREDPGLMLGLNVCLGHVTNESVAQDLDYDYMPPEDLFQEEHACAHASY
ncbi:MAG: alanine dehydrogenase [Chlamydiota bacterium]